jgi:predicted DNA-binding transcriptional regulator AlpA
VSTKTPGNRFKAAGRQSYAGPPRLCPTATFALLEGISAQLEGLKKLLAKEPVSDRNLPRLHRKDLMQRYGISEPTLHRWIRKGLLPEPVRFSGPLWTLADLEAREMAGRLPRPVSP